MNLPLQKIQGVNRNVALALWRISCPPYRSQPHRAESRKPTARKSEFTRYQVDDLDRFETMAPVCVRMGLGLQWRIVSLCRLSIKPPGYFWQVQGEICALLISSILVVF